MLKELEFIIKGFMKRQENELELYFRGNHGQDSRDKT